jgi:hypothetical protein
MDKYVPDPKRRTDIIAEASDLPVGFTLAETALILALGALVAIAALFVFARVRTKAPVQLSKARNDVREMPSMRLGTCAASSTLAVTTLSAEKPMCGIEMRLKLASLTTMPLQQTNRHIAA